MKNPATKSAPVAKPVISISLELLPTELQTAAPEHLAHLITIGHKVITIKDSSKNSENKASAILGQIGEDMIRKIYEKRFSIENVSKQGRTGDILIRRSADPARPNRQAILIEIKNYSTAVGSAEIEKFYRDLSANAAIGGGIFISLNTKITGFDSNLHFTKRGDMPIIFLSLDWMINSNPDTVEELVTLTADIIWTHLDSRFLVDKEIFQKLSSKLTKLNDCINGLSLNRAYISETRQMIDKQLTKIYETSYETEISMRSIISNITKTLAKGSSEDQHNNDSNGDSTTYEYPDQYLDGFMILANTHFQDSLYNTDADHSELVNLAIETIYEAQESNPKKLTITYHKKGIKFASSNSKKLTLNVHLLKSRTDILYLSNKNLVSCPNWASCDEGIIIFPLDVNSVRRETIADIKQTVVSNL